MILLQGKPLENIDSSILVTEFEEFPPDMDTEETALFPYGSAVTYKRRKKLTCEIHLVILERNKQRRQRILQRIQMWAREGGRLEVSWRENMFLQVRAESLPLICESEQWLREISLTFSAVEIPWWQSKVKSTANLTGTSGTLVLNPLGNAPFCPVDFSAECSSPCHTLQLGTIKLNMGENPVSKVKLSHGQKGILTITDENGSDLRRFRTRDSGDDLLAVPGKANMMEFSADVSCSVVCEAAGWSE